MARKKRLGSDPLESAGENKTAKDHDGKKVKVKKSKKIQGKKPDTVWDLHQLKIEQFNLNKGMKELCFTGNMIINTINEQKEILDGFLEFGGEINLNFSSVEKMDSASFQLIMAFIRDIKTYNGRAAILKASEDVSKLFSLYGEDLP